MSKWWDLPLNSMLKLAPSTRDFGQNKYCQNMKRFLWWAIPLFILCSCSFTANCRDPQDTSCTRILFIGNSYTFVNDLPISSDNRDKSGGHIVAVALCPPDVARLADHIG